MASILIIVLAIILFVLLIWKGKINEFVDIKLQKLYNHLDKYTKNIEAILNTKRIKPLPRDMKIINELIINYTELVNNQNNHYLLKISEKPFNILYNFIHYNLEPPLVLIKEQYNSIEERLLNEIINIIKTFPDNYLFVQNKLELESLYIFTSY